jgi:hypothetical protein
MTALNYAGTTVTGDASAETSLANATHTLPASTRGVLVLRNTHATNASTYTIVVPGTQYGQARPDVGPVTIPAAGVAVVVGGLVADLADPADGLIDLVIAGTGTVVAKAYEV